MTGRAVATPDEDAVSVPGRCGEHPNQRLVTRERAGFRRYGSDVAVVCPDPAHDDNDRERCRWCGGLLVEPATPRWTVSERREYCTPNHRLRAFRARPRETS